MRAFNCPNSGKTIFYHSDFSDVRIYDNKTEEELQIPLERDDLVAFAGMIFLDEAISTLEDKFG